MALGRHTVGLAVACGLVATAPAAAHAGALGQVIGGLTNQIGAPPANQTNSSSSGGSSGGGLVEGIARGLLGDWSNEPTTGIVQPMYSFYPPGTGENPDVSLYLGAQSVEDSDGSVSVEMSATYREFGISARDTSYFEQAPDYMHSKHYLHLDLWGIGGHYQLYQDGKVALWLDGGLAGLSTENDVSAFGVQVGARLERRLQGELGVGVEAHTFLLQHDVRAVEWRAIVQASVLQVGYRDLRFDVGPPLRGPEVGIEIRF